MVMQVMGISCKYRGSCSPPLRSLVPNRGSGTPAVYGAYLGRQHQVERGGLWKQTDFQTVHDLSVQLSAGPFSPVQFSRSVVSNSLQPHGLQHARLPCPSPTPRACSNSCPLSW